MSHIHGHAPRVRKRYNMQTGASSEENEITFNFQYATNLVLESIITGMAAALASKLLSSATETVVT